MKFKIATICLLVAILVTCIYTSCTLIKTETKQFELQKILVDMELSEYEIGAPHNIWRDEYDKLTQ